MPFKVCQIVFHFLELPWLKVIPLWLTIILLMLKYLLILCYSNENDITERLKRIIQANASLHQELSETSPAGKNLVI